MHKGTGRHLENSTRMGDGQMATIIGTLSLGRFFGWLSVEGDTAMAMPTFFVQECPTCGRNLEIRVEYLGRTVSCRHCRGQFVAAENVAPPPRAIAGTPSSLLARADELLALAESSRLARLMPF